MNPSRTRNWWSIHYICLIDCCTFEATDLVRNAHEPTSKVRSHNAGHTSNHSHFFVVPSNICLGFTHRIHHTHANSLVATFALCSPYYSTLALFLKMRLRLMNMPLTHHSHKQASVMNVNGIFNR